MCPVDHVPSAESGLPSGQPLPGPGLGDFQIQLLAALMAHTQAMQALTEAVASMARSNESLVQAMCDSDGVDPDEMPRTYMDGSPIR